MNIKISEEKLKNWTETAKNIRRETLGLAFRCEEEKAHLGGMLSMVDILTVLYNGVLNIKNAENWEARDRFILSKGHGSLAMYSAMHSGGILTDEDLSCNVRGDDTVIYRHSKLNEAKAIEFSSGSLGLGMPYGLGLAVGLKKKKFDSRVFVMVGDGECNEGVVWESTIFAGSKKVDNFCVIVDKNNIQLDGYTKDIMPIKDYGEIFKSFGFEVININGHDFEEIYSALTFKSDKPIAIIAETVKGKGVSYAENSTSWHSNVVTAELLEIGLKEIV